MLSALRNRRSGLLTLGAALLLLVKSLLTVPGSAQGPDTRFTVIRRRRSSRFTLLLAVVGLLAASLVAVPATSAAETPYSPLVRAHPAMNLLGGMEWTPGVDVLFVIDSDDSHDPEDSDTYLLKRTATVDEDGNLALGLDEYGFQLLPGHHISATGGGITKTLVVADIQFDVNRDTGAVDGTTSLPDPTGHFEILGFGDGDVGRWVGPVESSFTANLATDPINGSDMGKFDLPLDPNVFVSVLQVEADGDETEMSYDTGSGGPTSYWFTVETPNQVWGNGENWPIDATIDLTIDDSTGGEPFTDSTQVVWFGTEPQPWEKGFRFDLSSSFTIESGHIVTITSDFDNDGILDVDKELVVADISLTEIEAIGETGIVSGYAPPDAWVTVNAGNESEWAWREVQAAPDTSTEPPAGYWEADLATYLDDESGLLSTPFPNGTGGSAQIVDEDGDATHRGWCIGCGGGGEAPTVIASVWPDTYVRGSGWNGSDLYITLDKSPVDGEPEWTLPLPVDTYEDGIQYNGWDFEIRAPFWGALTLDYRDVLTVTATGDEGEDVVKTLIVTGPLSITAVDREMGTVEGKATTGQEVNVAKWGDDFGHPHTEVTVDVTDGMWTATLPPFWAGSGGAATIWDDDGDGTEATWGAPFIATGVDAQEGADSVWGGFWYLDDSVTVGVTRGTTVVYEPAIVSVQDDWWRGFATDLPGVELEVGDIVTVTGNESQTINTHKVLELTVEWEDAGDNGAGNTVYGTTNAPEGWIVSVEAHDYDAHRSTQVDSDGSWLVDYDDSSETSGDVRIEQGIGGRVEVLDPEGNRTWAQWGTQGHGEADPILIAQAEEDIWIRGSGYDGLGPLEVRVIDESGLPYCPGTIPFEGEFEASGADLCDGGEFVGGHHLGVYTPGTEGALIRDFTIHDIRISAVDVDADSVSGVGTPGVQVQAGIYEEGQEEDESVTLALRYAMPDVTTGMWTVFFNAAPDEDAGESGQMPIDGREGDARQYEEDGDFTESQWADRQPQMYVNLIADTVILEAWPTGPDITLDVFESEAAGAILVHTETIEVPGPYYTAHVETDLGGTVVLSGEHVVASNGVVEESHNVTAVSITSFDFDNDSYTGTATGEGTTVVAGASNDTGEWEIDDLSGPFWTADFSGHVDFSDSNHIEGFVAEFDEAQNATFFTFEADYEKLTVGSDGSTATTGDGSITVSNLDGEGISVTTSEGSCGELECVGRRITIESDGPPASPDHPRIITLRIPYEQISPYVGPEDILVFRNNVLVPSCKPILDDEGDFPCVSDRIRLDGTGDIELTVKTLVFSTWTMAFRSPSVDSFVAATEPVPVNTTVTAVGTFADVSVAMEDRLTATITWGDGECEIVPIVDGRVAASKVHDEAGVFTLALHLYDKSETACADADSLELIDEAEYQFVVVYDPAGGFVTGGGWIESPEGAYVGDPSMTGKATFGFVSKYKKGASVPTGNTEFQFRAGNLNFNSTSYDWLVVTGSDYAKFKGIGTINGDGAYKFQIWAGDDSPDTFRIKIWTEDETGLETVVYDNGSNKAIGGGSIIVHAAKK